MNNIELHNSYKCFDSIPTADESKQFNEYERQSVNIFTSGSNNLLFRSASLDSLINSSDLNSSLDELSDSDSLSELKHITPNDEKNINAPRRSDIEAFNDAQPPKEPVIQEYLEKSHKSCDYENCGFKKDLDEKGRQTLNNVKAIRRNSVANSDSNLLRRMETIIEEPYEPKISVKEILARFETMRESAEVKPTSSYFMELDCCINYIQFVFYYRLSRSHRQFLLESRQQPPL